MCCFHSRTAYRCEKEATGELNRDTLINYINEIALNTPDAEEKVKFEPGLMRGKQYVPKYTEAESADMEKAESGQVRLDPEEEEALNTATLDDIMALADFIQHFDHVFQQYFEFISILLQGPV